MCPSASGPVLTPDFESEIHIREKVVVLFVAADAGFDVLENEFLFVENGVVANAGELPSGDVLEIIVVALGFADAGAAILHFGVGFGELVFESEVAATGFFPLQSVVAQGVGELEEVGDPTGLFQLGVEAITVAGNANVLPEVLADAVDFFEGKLETFFGASHAALVPNQEDRIRGGRNRRSGFLAPREGWRGVL